MTTIVPERWRCPVCETESEQMLVLSTNTFGGSSDLDTRPAEMMRSTLPHSVWSCPGCGFASAPVERAPSGEVEEDVAELVRGEQYQAQREDSGCPELANAFLCRALLAEEAGRLASSGWDALRAAWVCDDAGQTLPAERCRSRAVELWRRAEQKGEEIVEGGLAAAQLLLADLLRRARDFDEARACCHRGLSGRPKEPLRSLLEYELELITAEDDVAHSIGEVLGPR